MCAVVLLQMGTMMYLPIKLSKHRLCTNIKSESCSAGIQSHDTTDCGDCDLKSRVPNNVHRQSSNHIVRETNFMTQRHH